MFQRSYLGCDVGWKLDINDSGNEDKLFSFLWMEQRLAVMLLYETQREREREINELRGSFGVEMFGVQGRGSLRKMDNRRSRGKVNFCLLGEQDKHLRQSPWFSNGSWKQRKLPHKSK